MIGIVYGKRWNAGWEHACVRAIPSAVYVWKCNESFWLLPHVAQAMCWGEPVGSA